MDAAPSDPPATTIRAAQYLRMSTEHQKYSLGNQAAVLAKYAEARGYHIVRSYADAGISGVDFRKRGALQQLLRDVISGEAEVSVILTYDVSRWGRFPDPDQAAHYEFLCREAGANVEYAAEQFQNDGSLTTSLLKNIKRVMAAEFSRELSAKVTSMKARTAQRGFWAGGPAGYGLRRRTIHFDGSLGAILGPGEHKASQSDRVILVPGPAGEVATVRRIYRLFLIDGLHATAIARRLNDEGSTSESGAPWTRDRVRQILSNPKYVGDIVYGRKTFRMDVPLRRNPPEEWQRVPGAFEAIVSRQMFEAVQANLPKRKCGQTKIQLLDQLRRVWAEKGYLSAGVIGAAPYAASAAHYSKVFGGLTAAYELVGYKPNRRQECGLAHARSWNAGHVKPPLRDFESSELIQRLRALYQRAGYLNIRLIDDDPETPNAHYYRRRFGGMRHAYALAGYIPTLAQEHRFERTGGQTISRERAQQLALDARRAGDENSQALASGSGEPDPPEP